MADLTPHPADNGTTVTHLAERALILCRTCLRPITWETRTEPGFKPRTGFYDDARVDALVCFKAVSYRHEPLTDREWAYYEAGQKGALHDAADAVPIVSCRLQTCFREDQHPAPSGCLKVDGWLRGRADQIGARS